MAFKRLCSESFIEVLKFSSKDIYRSFLGLKRKCRCRAGKIERKALKRLYSSDDSRDHRGKVKGATW